MKKRRVKKAKSSNRRLTKPHVSFLKENKLIIIGIAVLLLLAVVLSFIKPTGNAVTGEVVKTKAAGAVCGEGVYSSLRYDCGDGTCATTQPECGTKKLSGSLFATKLEPITPGKWTSISTYIAENNVLAQILTFIFGNPISEQAAIAKASAGIITVAMWLLLFITFSDIIASFSTFSKPVAWGAGFLITLIIANIGWIVATLAWLIGALGFLGGLSIVAGLGIAFVAFIAVNFGIGKFAGWALQRRATMTAHQAMAGGKKVAGAIKGMGDINDALSKLGMKP